MKSTITITILFLASLCAAQRGEINIDPPYSELRYDPDRISIIRGEGTTIATTKPNPDAITLTIEDVQDVVCRDNEPLRRLFAFGTSRHCTVAATMRRR
jgi:hypothetical protein